MIQQRTVTAATAEDLTADLEGAGVLLVGSSPSMTMPGVVNYVYLGRSMIGISDVPGVFAILTLDDTQDTFAAMDDAIAPLIYHPSAVPVIEPAPPPVDPVQAPGYRPSWMSVSPRQFRQALTRKGLRASVEAMIGQTPDPDVKDWWEFASTFERDHALVVYFGQVLNQSSEQMDTLFRLAATL